LVFDAQDFPNLAHHTGELRAARAFGLLTRHSDRSDLASQTIPANTVSANTPR
jgi:hypothetical protein